MISDNTCALSVSKFITSSSSLFLISLFRLVFPLEEIENDGNADRKLISLVDTCKDCAGPTVDWYLFRCSQLLVRLTW